MEKHLRTCVVCKKSYSYCPRCNEDKNKETWHLAYCSSDCRTVYKTLTSYAEGDFGADTAKSILDKCDLSRREYFGESYTRILEQIERESVKTEPEFPYMNAPVENNTPAIAEETNEKKEIGKKAAKIVKKSIVAKTVDGDLEN